LPFALLIPQNVVANAKEPSMISQTEFERLINVSESSTLDFKSKMYEFQNDKDLTNTAKFVKDIISFSIQFATKTLL